MSIAKELAHVIANHTAEQKSCSLTSIVAAGGMALMLGLAGVSVSLTLAVACQLFLVSGLARPRWLHRKQVYETDAIAAAISVAAGSSPESILTSMQRAYLADTFSPEKKSVQQACVLEMPHTLLRLQILLPHSQIPQEPFTDSTGVQHVIDAAADEVSSASTEVKLAY